MSTPSFGREGGRVSTPSFVFCEGGGPGSELEASVVCMGGVVRLLCFLSPTSDYRTRALFAECLASDRHPDRRRVSRRVEHSLSYKQDAPYLQRGGTGLRNELKLKLKFIEIQTLPSIWCWR